MHLVDMQNLLREETSLASFTVGFKLAWGLSKELEADGLYSFDNTANLKVTFLVNFILTLSCGNPYHPSITQYRSSTSGEKEDGTDGMNLSASMEAGVTNPPECHL